MCLETLKGQEGSYWKSFFHFADFILCCLSLSLLIYSPPCPCSIIVLDKLDEILAAAQHTITSDNQGQRGHGGKRDRSKSIAPNVSNEVHWELNGNNPMVAAITLVLLTFLDSISISANYSQTLNSCRFVCKSLHTKLKCTTELLHCFKMYHLFIHGSD